MIFLKQSTASQSVTIGPFVDSTDASLETALSIANTDIRLSAAGGNFVSKNSGGATYDESGMYTITLDATDTATVGSLQLVCAITGTLPVYHEFYVVEEAIYNDLFATSATGLAKAAALTTVDNEIATLQTTASGIQTDLDNATDGLGAIKTAVDALPSAADVNAQCDTALSDYGALRPTVAGRTLDVTTGGNAGVDFANINGTLSNSSFAADWLTASGLAADAATEIAAAVVGTVVEPQGSITLRQALAYCLAYAAGETTGADTTSPVYKTPNGVLNRITGTTDGSGNRSTVTFTAPIYS